MCFGLFGFSLVDINNFGDFINESEGIFLKRRCVFFGGYLRFELFDENLFFNMFFKRGEVLIKRKFLVMYILFVLKKIIKE